MNKNQKLQLKRAAATLTRAEQDKNLQGVARAYGAIKDAVAEIYQGKIDAPTVIGVEKILNQGQANIPGNSIGAYEDMKKLAGQAETGMEAYGLFEEEPKQYVKTAYGSRAGVSPGRPFHNNIPYDSVRSALANYRGRLVAELTQRTRNGSRTIWTRTKCVFTPL